MLCNRMKQFREYNKLDCTLVAEVLGISESEYKDFENNKTAPTIDIITALASFYKVTVDEFYGYTPRLSLHSEEKNFQFDDVSESILKMSDLSWDEARLILYYRAHKDEENDEIIKKILEKEE
ncbi:MAG: helix-turn-helix transcriptional regulator [Clostridia bacterium]|nr:helix-turn-helix transcriptional regulator [Clostridia bacterium]